MSGGIIITEPYPVGKDEQYLVLVLYSVQCFFICLATIIFSTVVPKHSDPSKPFNPFIVILYFLLFLFLIFIIIKIIKLKPNQLRNFSIYGPIYMSLFVLYGFSIVIVGIIILEMVKYFWIFQIISTILIESFILIWIRLDNRTNKINWFPILKSK